MNQMIRLLVISGALALLAVGGACTVQGGVRSTARPAPTPNLIAIGGGVYVVENHSQSVFYSDGYYWMAGNGGWYRSSYYNRGWAYVDYGYVPQRVVRIRRPRSYVRYRARPGMRVQRASNVDHRRRAQPRARTAPAHRSNTRVRASRGRAPAPAHRANPPRTRSSRPAARPATRVAPKPARKPARKPAKRRKYDR